MFYKIDPTLRQVFINLGAEGFLAGDRVWVHLKGDFQPTPNGGNSTDTFRNTRFEIGSKSFFANEPKTVTAPVTTLVATNLDDPLGDNSDPDNDYGVRVKLDPFSGKDDVFRFRGRDDLPEIQGSLYKAGGGDDLVVMPDAPVQGFNTGRVFNAGSGDDVVRAGALDLKLNFAAGADTLVLKDAATIGWGNGENRDRDGVLVLRTGDGVRHQVANAEVLKVGADKDPLVKWYFSLARDDDGGLRAKFFENGALIAEGAGFYDEALPVPNGKYQASFRKDGALGPRIELTDVSGFETVLIRKGQSGGNAETDFVTSGGFLKAVFDQIGDAYALAGTAVPWQQGSFTPLVPVTVAVGGAVDQPFLRARNLVTDDRSTNVVKPRFDLRDDGDDPGLEYKSVQVFFKVEGRAEKGEDWTFAGGTTPYNGANDFASKVVRHGTDGDGDVIYSVMLERGERSVAVPIEIFRDRQQESNEKIKLQVVDIDLWAHRGGDPALYRLSGGPNADRERDFDGPTGLEARLLPDDEVVITIFDDLVS
jgi:hypothetical protein